MPAHAVVLSPVLVGRDDVLAAADRRLSEVADGAGGLLLVAGEAGIGKSRLLGAVARRAASYDFAVVRAAAFPGDVQASAGLLLDLAGSLASAPHEALAELGRDLARRLRAPVTAAGDAHRRRRLLEQDLVDLIAQAEPGARLLVILEDLHWADQLSLEVIGHLAGRLAARPILIAGAYRSDELYPGMPMRDLRARLLRQRLAQEMQLQRLSAEETATVTSAVLARPAPAELARAIHERSDGIPLHVEELLAAIDPDGPAHQAVGVGAPPSVPAVPDTLADAVLTRSRRLTARTQEVATAAAVIGRTFDFDLLTAVTGAHPTEVSAAVRELLAAHLIVPGSTAATYDFRHALIRDALYADGDLPVRRRIHERVARAASGGPDGADGAERAERDAFVSAHYEHAGRGDLAYRHAIAAARSAASISSHRAALELYRRAVRTAGGLTALERADLLVALGDEAAASDDNAAAAEAYDTAYRLRMDAGDVRAAAALVPRAVAVAHLLGADLETRVRRLTEALEALGNEPDADLERARLRSAMAAAYMLDRRLDEAIVHGGQSLAESRRLGDDETTSNVGTTLGSVLIFAGRMDEGWALLDRSAADARDNHQEAEAARAYRMIGSSASVLVEYDRAERLLDEGMRYAERVELWNHRHYMAAHLAHVQWATGHWQAATRTAQQALADGRGGITTRITAQYVLGYLAMGRGEWPAATELLAAALQDGEKMGELQRLSPPLWGLAEVARLQGDHETALLLCERGLAASASVTDAAYLFPFLVTGTRAHLARAGTGTAGLSETAAAANAAQEWSERVGAVLRTRAIPGTLPAIGHARGLIGLARGDAATARRDLEAARASWLLRRRFWEEAWAGLDLADVAIRQRRRSDAAQLADAVGGVAAAVGAGPLLAAAERRAAASARGGPGRTGRVAARFEPLSAREFEVAQLVAAGLTNRQIAERLVVAPKTVSAHVEHILAKLHAARRAEIATWCASVPHAI